MHPREPEGSAPTGPGDEKRPPSSTMTVPNTSIPPQPQMPEKHGTDPDEERSTLHRLLTRACRSMWK